MYLLGWSSPDLFMVKEHLGGWEGECIAWVGDGNNMASAGSRPPRCWASSCGSRARRIDSNGTEAATKSGFVMVKEVSE
jgi:hypothetical protein